MTTRKRKKPVLIACGDAPNMHTGFANVMRNVLDLFIDEFDIHVLALNWDGNCPDHDRYPYRYWNPAPKPMAGEDGQIDLWGHVLLPKMVKAIRPDLILFVNDLAGYSARWQRSPQFKNFPTIGFVAFESELFPRWWASGPMRADATVVFSDWGKRILCERNPVPPEKVHVIPHGYEPTRFHTTWKTLEERNALRAKIGMPEDAFIAFRCDRNEYRKQWPLSFQAFKQFLDISGAQDAYLYAHTSYDDYFGWNFEDMLDVYARDYPEGRIIMTSGYNTAWKATSQTNLNMLYNLADIYFSTTGGEAYGLPMHEAQAAGCPVLAPANTAVAEVVHGGWLIRGLHRINLIASIEYLPPNVDETAQWLNLIYQDVKNGRTRWWEKRQKGIEWATQRTWSEVLKPLPALVEQVMSIPKSRRWRGKA